LWSAIVDTAFLVMILGGVAVAIAGLAMLL
jgi:hypothetical protein